MQSSLKCEYEELLALNGKLCEYRDGLEEQIESYESQMMEKVIKIPIIRLALSTLYAQFCLDIKLQA